MPDMKNSRVLIIDDELHSLKASQTVLKMNGFSEVETEIDSRKVMERMSSGRIDAVILDLFMPHVSGMDLLPQLMERYPQVPVIVVTAAYEVERAVECMKMGAYDFLIKPVESKRLVTTLRKALEQKALTENVTALRDHLINDNIDHPEAFEGIITRNRKMRALFQYTEIVARTPQPVLITGESGTGKELIAQAIHRLSGCSGEFVPVNLAGLDDTMFSDTLFGHKRGAFTGADQHREGLIIKAAGGVLFMDEIADLAESSQIKLLRLIQEREFYPVGSDTPRCCEARIVCASNKDIKALVDAGRFRNDLYFRLCVHIVALPPLRERKEDIPLLLNHFIKTTADSLNIKCPAYPKELPELLTSYHFPGNIRELQGMVIDAVTRRRSDMISMESFHQTISSERSHPSTPAARAIDDESLQKLLEEIWGHFPSLREAEDFLIDTALRIARGNQGIAATMLGLKRQTFNMRLKARKENS